VLQLATVPRDTIPGGRRTRQLRALSGAPRASACCDVGSGAGKPQWHGRRCHGWSYPVVSRIANF
jgi:hypothetical protein